VFVRKDELTTFNTNKKVTKVSTKGQKYYEPLSNVIEAKNNDGKTSGLNQATFSSDFVMKLLRMYAPKDKDFVVYDPFMGTGSTAVGCINYGCSYIGTELSEKQIEYSRDRVELIEEPLLEFIGD
jgi:DNA modification methylase